MPVQFVSLSETPVFRNLVITGGLVPRGCYNASTTYAIGDFVSYSGSSYVLYAITAAGTAPSDNTKWQLVAQGVA